MIGLPLFAAYLYTLLFEAASQTLLRVARERLGGVPGITAVLHTWGQQLAEGLRPISHVLVRAPKHWRGAQRSRGFAVGLHPHLHCIVTGGGLAVDGTWRPGRSPGYLCPVNVPGAIFRGKFLAGLNALKDRGAIAAPRCGWPALWRQLGGKRKWVVYAKPPFGGPEQVLSYLSNYTHRVAISARRILGWDETARTVTFCYRVYADGSQVKVSTIDADTFLARFRRHMLPCGFTKIRHHGILANQARSRLVPAARTAIAPVAAPAAPATGEQTRCPHCGDERLPMRGLLRPDGRFFACRTPGPLPAPGAIRDSP